MELQINRLVKRINNKKIAIYGAGYWGKIAYHELKKNGICIEFFVVTNINQSEQCIDSKEIREITGCIDVLHREDIIVIVCVDVRLENEIIDVLLANKVNDFIAISQYLKDQTYYEKFFETSENEKWSKIREWYQEKNHCEIPAEIEKKRLLPLQKKSKSILFVVSNAIPRTLKIARELNKNGYGVEVILFKNGYYTNEMEKSLLKTVDKFYEADNIEDVIVKAIEFEGQAIHYFTDWGNYVNVAIMISVKRWLVPIVIDMPDFISGLYVNIDDKVILREKYICENADAVCCRDYGIEFAKDKLGYCISPKSIIFLDYFDEVAQCEDMEKKELSLCYIGGIVTEERFPNSKSACFLELAEKCMQNKCHLHVYPRNWDENLYQSYLVCNRENPYFHFHKPIVYDEVLQVISKYDYGIHPIKRGFESISKEDDYITPKKLTYGTANKLFDYLAAGLPIIAASPTKVIECLRSEGLVIDWTIEDYDFNELKRIRKVMKESVLKKRSQFLMENQIHRLINLYDNI